MDEIEMRETLTRIEAKQNELAAGLVAVANMVGEIALSVKKFDELAAMLGASDVGKMLGVG